MSDIYHDYQSALDRARELEEYADELKKLYENDLDSMHSLLLSNWSGISAEEAIKKYDKIKETLKKEERQLRFSANSIRTISKTWYETEKRIQEELERARQRLNLKP